MTANKSQKPFVVNEVKKGNFQIVWESQRSFILDFSKYMNFFQTKKLSRNSQKLLYVWMKLKFPRNNKPTDSFSCKVASWVIFFDFSFIFLVSTLSIPQPPSSFECSPICQAQLKLRLEMKRRCLEKRSPCHIRVKSSFTFNCRF